MSSANSAAIAPVLAEYDSLRTNLMCGLALTTLLSYDVVLTFGQECQYIWRSPKTWVSRVLYVLNRHPVLLYNILGLGTIPRISDTVKPIHMSSDPLLSDGAFAGSCTVLSWFAQSIVILGLIGPAVFTALRIYALSRKNRILSGVALVLSLAPFVINAATAYQDTLPINAPAPVNCTEYSKMSTKLHTTLIFVSRGCLILADTLAVTVTWRQTRRVSIHTASTRRPSLEEVIWANGSLYFCTLVSLNVVNLALVIASDAIAAGGGGPASSYVLVFADTFSSILNSRFLLALHETNARLEGGTTSISSLVFNVDDNGNPIGDGSVPELPAFLEPLGGSIHSFHNDDDEGNSLEVTRPSQSEHESEPEVEGGVEVVDVGMEAGSSVGASGNLA